MATSANAVFTEVLQLEVQTAQFQADMDSLVAMYTQAIDQMNASSAGTGMDTGMAALAVQLQTLSTQAAASLDLLRGSAAVTANELLNTADAAQAATVSLTEVGVASEVAGNTAADAGYKAGLSWENFGRQLQRTMLRLPAMLIVATAMGAVFELIKAPIDLIVEGFKDLEQSPLGNKVRDDVEALDVMRTRFAEIAATPVFDFIASQLEELKKWLITNKDYVDQLMVGFGNLAATFLSVTAELLKMDSTKDVLKGLAEVAVSIATAFTGAVDAVTTLFALLETKEKHGLLGSDSLENDIARDKQGLSTHPMSYLFRKPNESDNPEDEGNIVKAFDARERALQEANDKMYAAIEGMGKEAVPSDLPKQGTDTPASLKAEFKTKVDEAKVAYSEQAAAYDRAVHSGLKSHQDVDPGIHASIKAEQDAVRSLIGTYKEKAEEAIRNTPGKKTTEQVDAAVKASNEGYDQVGLQLERSSNGRMAGAGYDDAAADERRDVKKQDAASDLALLKDQSKAEEILLDTQYHHGLLTIQEYYDKKRDAEEKDYVADMASLNKRLQVLPATGTAADTIRNEMQARGQKHDNAPALLDQQEADQLAKEQEKNDAEQSTLLKKQNVEWDTALKERYKNGLVTVQEYYTQKRAIDQLEHVQDLAELARKQLQSGVPGSVQSNAVGKQIDSSVQAYAGTQSATNSSEVGETAKVAEELQKTTDALTKQEEAQAEINVRLLESNNHRKAGLALEEQILKMKTAQAELDLKAAGARVETFAPGTAERASAEVEQQAASNNLLASYSAQIQGARNSAGGGLFPTLSGAQAGLSAAQTISDSAKTQLNDAQMKEASSPGSVDPAAMQALTQEANAAAQALQRAAAAATVVSQFMDALKDATAVIGMMKDAVDEYVAGQKKGGWVGGVAAVMSNKGISGAGGLLQSGANAVDQAGTAIGGGVGDAMNMAGTAISSAMPVIGPAIGMMFSVITSLFQSGIQKMVDAINAQINNIHNAAASGSIGLGQEITELQAAEQSAIQQLGGSKKKGAQQQLTAILQSLNAEIAQLQFQQQQIIQNFNNMASAGGLDTLSGTFATWYNTWNSINQQVKQYVDAGGSIATANEYLNQQLAIQQQSLQNQLNQGDQTALNDAVQLNQLLTQRVQLMKTEAQTEFGIVNADSVERQTSQAVAAGNQLQTQRYNFQQQLLQMNENITLDQQRLSIEGQIFNVSGNIQQLWAKLNADNISSLQQQVAQYKDMQTILQSTQGLTFSGPISTLPTSNLPVPGEPSVAGPITVNVVTTGNGINSGNAGEVGNAIAIALRSGRTSLTVAT
jgi:hypothetical protein